jgi:hypothetical protein
MAQTRSTGARPAKKLDSGVKAKVADQTAGEPEHWSGDGVADIVPLGVLRGREEIAGLFRDLFAALPDLPDDRDPRRGRRA